VVRESAARHFRSPLRHIGIDEVSYGHGHQKVLTIVVRRRRPIAIDNRRGSAGEVV
jgi:hypothetical protein